MNPKVSRLICLAFGLFLGVVGVFCLNYTNGFGLSHHTDWAAEHGMPQPSYSIFVAGVSLVALGAGAAGYAIGRRSKD